MTARIIYVDASRGNDKTGNGTKKKPFRTFERARQMFIRSVSRKPTKRGVTQVKFAPGYYAERIKPERGMAVDLSGIGCEGVDISKTDVPCKLCKKPRSKHLNTSFALYCIYKGMSLSGGQQYTPKEM